MILTSPGPLMVSRTVASYISAGVAAMHIEGQVVNKRCGHLRNKELVPLSEYVSRIRAAALNREELRRDIVIIARTDALADHGYDEAVARLQAAVDAGADVVFLEGVRNVEEAKRVCDEFGNRGVPCLYNCVPGGMNPVLSVKEARGCVYRLVITPTLALGAVYESVEKLYKELLEDGNTKGNGVAVRDLFDSCGLKEATDFDIKAGEKLYQNGI